MYAEGASPFFGDSASSGEQGGYNKIYDTNGGIRIRAIRSATTGYLSLISAKLNSWGSCPPLSSYFSLDVYSRSDSSSCRPLPPMLVQPVDGSVAINPYFTICRWHKVPLMETYHLQLDDTPAFIPPFIEEESTTGYSQYFSVTACGSVCIAPGVSYPSNN